MITQQHRADLLPLMRLQVTSLEQFIVNAKANGWGFAQLGGKRIAPSKLGSLDITFEDGEYFYQDSFVGLRDFCGQEHVCFQGEAVWSQAYYGFLTRPDLFDGQRTVEVLRAALGSMCGQGRFLGGFEFKHQQCTYRDSNSGDYRNFHGEEEIILEDIVVYRLRYFGGLVLK